VYGMCAMYVRFELFCVHYCVHVCDSVVGSNTKLLDHWLGSLSQDSRFNAWPSFPYMWKSPYEFGTCYTWLLG